MTAKITKLGKYTLSEQLGSGGFGAVYKATDSIGRNVAVKVLKPGWSDDPGAIERFRREAQVAGELFHNRIATIIDFDEAEGRLFLVMRYIDGIPLDKLIKEKGRLEWAQALQILEQAAEGLDYAHQRGFIHRDIKPANILISAKEGAVLTDFGLVRAAVASGMSTSGVMLGTPQYIAPELWEGKPATPATDIYSLACVAYEMLTGQVLFAGVSPPEIMTKHMQAASPLPKTWPQGVPASVGNVLLRALQRDPGKRYASAGDFIADLKGKLSPKTASRPASTKNISTSSDTLGWREKSIPFLLILMGLPTILALIGSLGITAGIGLFLRKEWARRMGMVFAGLVELLGFAIIFVWIARMVSSTMFPYEVPYLYIFWVISVLSILPAFYMLHILGGRCMANLTGGKIMRPAIIWQIIVGYSATVLGLIPAALLLIRKPFARIVAQVYAIFLMVVLPVAGLFIVSRMNYGESYTQPNYLGWFFTACVALFFLGLCTTAIIQLDKPEIRAYYENKEGTA